jgi:hypothetical protein
MFTGFASENTPAIQVWDSFRVQNGSTSNSIYLTDDCAPIQLFRTGGNISNAPVNVYLPTAPIDGKSITILNQGFSSSNQKLQIRSASTIGGGTNTLLYTLGVGGSLTLVFSKQCISIGDSGQSSIATGWLSLTQSSRGAYNANSVVICSDNSNASEANCAIIGGSNNNATSNSAGVFAGFFNSASGQRSVALGGQDNISSSTQAAVVGGQVNTASNTNAAVIGGQSNTASGGDSAIVGGNANNASNASAFIGGGFGCSATNSYSSVVGGLINTASGDASIVLGGNYGTTRGIAGNFVAPASVSPIAALAGAQQTATLLLGRQTTDATATRLRSNTGAAGTQNQVILPNNSAYYVKGSIIATVTGGGNTKSWDFIATIKRGANAAATSIVGAVILNTIAQDAGASAWVVAVTADTTNGGLAVTVTGQAATTIRWVCKLESTEVTY